jgi:acyl dehydratase
MTTEQGYITDAMRAQIGKETPPVTYEIDKNSVRMFARSVGHTDPIYYDEAEAKKAGYRSLPCPPGYLGTPVFDPRRSGQVAFARIETPFKRVLNGGTEIEYLETPCAGDTLTATSKVVEIQERQGSLGPMIITFNETTYKDQDGKVVAIMRGQGISY